MAEQDWDKKEEAAEAHPCRDPGEELDSHSRKEAVEAARSFEGTFECNVVEDMRLFEESVTTSLKEYILTNLVVAPSCKPLGKGK